MKNLANCKPSEFLSQTNKIRKSVAKWLDDTDILKIRQKQPELKEGMSKEEIKKARDEQAKKNLNEMLDEMLEKHPDETLEVLAYMSFVEPKDIDKHSVSEYLGSFNELMNDKNVVSFLSSLDQLESKIG